MVIGGILFHTTAFEEVVVGILEVMEGRHELESFVIESSIKDGRNLITPPLVDTRPLECFVNEVIKVGNVLEVVSLVAIDKLGALEVDTIKSGAIEETV